MRKVLLLFYRLCMLVFLSLCVNNHLLGSVYPALKPVFVISVIFYLFIQVMPNAGHRRLQTTQLRICAGGCELLFLFLGSLACSLFLFLYGLFHKAYFFLSPFDFKLWISHLCILFLLEAVTFWNGMIRIFLTSKQLGIKWRIIAALCGMIPIVNLFVLGKMLRIVSKETAFENQKLLLNQTRKAEQICQTKYPLLLVHGVFFRDFRYFNYWGRVPNELTQNGANIFYGNQQSAASVVDCGKEIAERIKEIIKETGCEKVNIIAHSKGGLDSRYALTLPGIREHVASLTTINTPHRGCEFADFLLNKLGDGQKEAVASMYNSALKKVGDPNPDFLKAVYDLTSTNCSKFNEITPNVDGVYYQSFGSKLNVAKGGRFPLNMTHQFVKQFDGANDGLVGEESFPWGNHYEFISVDGKRGISHGDMIDLNRENFDGFDVREFYVQVVSKLREMGF